MKPPLLEFRIVNDNDIADAHTDIFQYVKDWEEHWDIKEHESIEVTSWENNDPADSHEAKYVSHAIYEAEFKIIFVDYELYRKKLWRTNG